MVDAATIVDPDLIKRLVEQAVEENVNKLVDQLCQDPEWTQRVESMINQMVVHETLTRFGSIDLGPAIKQRVDENMQRFTKSLIKNFQSTGITDQATKTELTVMDEVVVVENCLTANSIEAVDSMRVNNLVVTGSINTDNHSWQALSSEISQRALEQVSAEWTQDLIVQVTQSIQQQGINFDHVKIDGMPLVDGPKLSSAVTQSNLQTVGRLQNLQVQGEARFNNGTVAVLNRRLGINTDTPEKALSVWDEEVSIVIGKHKINQAYVGTNREQSLVLGVNRQAQLEIALDGLTTVKQLRIGLHRIGHDTKVPGWSGTRGDLVFNTNPGTDRVFAWVCLGAHRWQTLKSAE